MKIKDKKIQFYIPELSASGNRRSFPYTSAQYGRGGLWAYVRDLRASDKIAYGVKVDDSAMVVEINHNEEINGRYKAIYNGKVYDVSPPDQFENYISDTKFILTLSADKTTYALPDKFKGATV